MVDAYTTRSATVIAGLDTALIDKLVTHLDALRRARRQIWIVGNGGSAANAAHLTAHLQELGIRAHDLTADQAALTATANDHGYERVLMLTLRRLASVGQALIVLSGSGDSPNVVLALAEAARIGLLRLGLLGMGGGMAAGMCDLAFVVASQDYGPLEDAHSAIIHATAEALKMRQVQNCPHG